MSEEIVDFLKRTNVKDYYGPKYKAMVSKSRGLLGKCPPQKFLDKWTKLADEEFRNNLSDNDAVVTLIIAMGVSKDKDIPLYWCDDWELLYENMVLRKDIEIQEEISM